MTKKLLRTATIVLIMANAFVLQVHAQAIAGMQQAKKHVLVFNKPAVNFFEGALLGNGGMGVVVCTRPDAVVLYFGHNNVWDIRLAENHKEELKTFNYVFNKVKAIPSTLANLTDDAWYNQYNRMAGDNYSKSYPRPFPCGSVVLGFDRRRVQLLGHTLDISNGVCTVKMLTADKKELWLKLFTNMQADELLMQLTDAQGNSHANVFDRIKVIPDPSTPADIPRYEAFEGLQSGTLSFRQTLPYLTPDKYKAGEHHIKDKAFRLTVQVNTPLTKMARINWNGNSEDMAQLEAALSPAPGFLASISLQEGLNNAVSTSTPVKNIATGTFDEVLQKNNGVWADYWSRSAVNLSDDFLEQLWYRNLYFFNCATKDGVTCPGLFANWSYNNIGTAWHGDYHMNYNTQQPFWVTFASNHLDKNLPYVNLIEALTPVSRKWAKEYYELPGAYFPHSAFPVEMTMNPYPLPDWGWEVSETPWAVQGLWWHYLYSGDKDFLRKRAYEPMKAAVEFLTAYMKRPDAHGGERWKDSKYHVFPTVPPELYGLRPGFQYNYDCTVDLTLIKFLFKAFKQATSVLGTAKAEKKLLADINDILKNYPEYPTAESKDFGKVLVSVPGEHAQVVYNVPNALFTVFPGEDHGLHSDSATYQLIKNTYRNQQNEGGNDLVFINLQAARAGLLNIDEFKRHVNYSLLPNGTATDMVMQTRGRYGDQSDFNYMGGMGIWFENFALPAVVNECLMQSYNGTIRLFPNWPKNKDASFSTLRAAGAFLVSAEQKGGAVTQVKILSEKGNELRLQLPWPAGKLTVGNKTAQVSAGELNIKTSPGQLVTLVPSL